MLTAGQAKHIGQMLLTILFLVLQSRLQSMGLLLLFGAPLLLLSHSMLDQKQSITTSVLRLLLDQSIALSIRLRKTKNGSKMLLNDCITTE